MKPFVITFFILLMILQLQAANYCENIDELSTKWTHQNCSHQRSCCEISDGQWNLIVWYFLRVSSNVNVTQIVRETESCRYEHYINHFLSDLFEYTRLEYYMERIIYRKRDQILDKQQEIQVNTTYQWHAIQETHPTGYAGTDVNVLKNLI